MQFSLTAITTLIAGLAGTAAAGNCGKWPMRTNQDHLPDNPVRIGRIKREPIRATTEDAFILPIPAPTVAPQQ